MKGLFHLLLTFQVFINIFAYNFSCPGPGQWKFRSSQICPGDKKKYVCLYDVINKRIAENCNGPQIEQQGDKTVINIHNRLNTEKCSEVRYQPEAFTTIGNSRCVYEKSPCSDDGQVLLNNGSGKEDRSCRCDYRRGYAFVSMNRSDLCSCVPSQQDCSCYVKPCDLGKILSPDYSCITEAEASKQFQCNLILNEETYTKDKLEDIDDKIEEIDGIFAAKVSSLVLTLLMIVIFVILVCGEWIYSNFQTCCTKCCCTINYFNRKPRDVTVVEGETVELKCEVVEENTTSKWLRGEVEIRQSSKTFLTMTGKLHQLTIQHAEMSDEGQYTVDVNGRKRSYFLQVKAYFSEDLKTDSYKEGDTATLLCELVEENQSLQWFKDEVLITALDRYTIHMAGKQHRLTIQDVKLEDKGKYSVVVKNCKRSTFLEVEAFIVSKLKDTFCTEHEDVTFSCQVCRANMSAKWFRNDEEIISTASTDKYLVTYEDKLHTLTVKSLEMDDSGTYLIVFDNKISSKAKLYIQAFIVSELKDTVCTEHEDVTFSCQVYKANVSVKWFKNGVEISAVANKEKYLVYSQDKLHRLTVKSLEMDDSGTYSIAFSDNRPISAKLDVHAFIVSKLSDTVCTEHDEVTFSCQVYRTNVSAKWFKNDEEIISSANTDKYLVNAEDKLHRLTVKSLEMDDSGTYSIVFDNKIYSKAKLNIRDFFITPLKESICTEFENVTFTCEVYRENLTAKWFKDDAQIPESDNRFAMKSEIKLHTLQIERVKQSDSGTYKVEFENGMSSTADLVVLESISDDEMNYFKILLLLRKIAEPIVRMKFDAIINPDKLSSTLSKHTSTLKNLKGRKQISLNEYDLLFPRKAHYKVSMCLTNLKFETWLKTAQGERCNAMKEKVITTVMEKLLPNIPGHQEVEDVKFFEPVYFLMQFELEYNGRTFKIKELHQLLFHILEKAVNPFTFTVCDLKLEFSDGSTISKKHELAEDAILKENIVYLIESHDRCSNVLKVEDIGQLVHADKEAVMGLIEKLKQENVIVEVEQGGVKVITLSEDKSMKCNACARVCLIGDEAEMKETKREKHLREVIVQSISGLKEVCVVKGKDHEVSTHRPDILGVEFLLVSHNFFNETEFGNKLEWDSPETFTLQVPAQPSQQKLSSVSFQFIKSVSLKPSSEDFDIRLMILLLRNLLYWDITDHLPPDNNDTVAADLTRIKFYRNKIQHQYVKRFMTLKDFDEIWNSLYNPLLRLGGEKCEQKLSNLKKMKASSQVALTNLNKKFTTDLSDHPEIKEEDQTDNDEQLSSLPDGDKVQSHNEKIAYLINRLVYRVSRVKFDREFQPASLQQIILKKKNILKKMKDRKELTETQWNCLFPKNGEPSSGNFDFSLQLKLIFSIRDSSSGASIITHQDYEDLSKLKTVTDSLRKLCYEEHELEEIIQILKRLGGNDYLKIYTRQKTTSEEKGSYRP